MDKKFKCDTIRNKHYVSLQDIKFEFLAIKGTNVYYKFFYFIPKKPKKSWFPYQKTQLILIFCQTIVELCPFITSCFLGLHIVKVRYSRKDFLAGILEFSQKMNKRIRRSSKYEFVRCFFGRIRGDQKSFLNYLTFIYCKNHKTALHFS